MERILLPNSSTTWSQRTRNLKNISRSFSTSRTFWILFALGSVSETIYLFYFVASFYLPHFYDVPLLDLGKITQYEYDAAVKFVGAFGMLFLLYYCAYRVCVAEKTSAGDANARLILFFSLVFAITLLWIYPIGAADVFDYIFHGRILIHYNQNPFSSLIADYPNDPLYPYPAWKYMPSVYGPIWIILSGMASLAAGSDLLLNLLFYKGLVTCFFLLTTFLIYRSLNRMTPHYALPGTLLFAWNPLVLYETAGNGHNDIIMAFFVVLAIYFLSTKRQSLSVIALVGSGLMKFAAGLLAPLFLISIVKGITDWNKRLGFTARVSLLSVMLIVALYAPLWIGPQMFGIERREELFTSSFPTLAMLILKPHLGEDQAQFLVSRVSTLLFIAIFVWSAVRVSPITSRLIETSFELFYVYFLFLSLWFQPWYLIWVVPLASMIPRVDIANRTMLFSCTAIMSYFVFIFLWIWNAKSFDILAVQGHAVAVIYPLPIVLTLHSFIGKRIPTKLKETINRGVDGTDLRLN